MLQKLFSTKMVDTIVCYEPIKLRYEPTVFCANTRYIIGDAIDTTGGRHTTKKNNGIPLMLLK